jgi:hypothetical protein
VSTTGAGADTEVAFLVRDVFLAGVESATGGVTTTAGAATTGAGAATSVDFWLDLVTRGIFIYFTLSLSRLINEVFKQADFI